MENEIVDLILPELFNKEQAIEELNQKYNVEYCTNGIGLHPPRIKLKYVRNYVKELDEIENRHTKYDEHFWFEVEKLNRNKFYKFNIKFHIHPNIKILWFGFEKYSSTNYRFHEKELINEQYKLLQKIYYSRLEAENGK